MPTHCPRGNFLGLVFDNTTCPSRNENLLACPRQSGFTCCNSSHDKTIRTSYSRCILHGTSPSCCGALKEMSCIACNGEAAIAERQTPWSWCYSDCVDLLASCDNDFFFANHGKLRHCQPDDDLVCSRLSDFLSSSGDSTERIQNSKPICAQLGFLMAPMEDLYEESEGESCVSVLSIPKRGNYSTPRGCRLSSSISTTAISEKRLFDFFQTVLRENGQVVIASITTVLLIVIIFWKFMQRDKRLRYVEQGTEHQQQKQTTSTSDLYEKNELPSLEELRALRLRRYGADNVAQSIDS